jgi:hypothetical protein
VQRDGSTFTDRRQFPAGECAHPQHRCCELTMTYLWNACIWRAVIGLTHVP